MTRTHREPVNEWLKDLDRNDRRTIGYNIKTVEIGWPLGVPLVRKMDKDLWEVRSNISDGRIASVLFTICETAMVLLHGFEKRVNPRQRLIWILPKKAVKKK